MTFGGQKGWILTHQSIRVLDQTLLPPKNLLLDSYTGVFVVVFNTLWLCLIR